MLGFVTVICHFRRALMIKTYTKINVRFLSLFYFLIIQIHQTMAQTKPFVPSDFKVPDKYENQHFRLRMLTVHDVVKDYDAVMTSVDHLQGVLDLILNGHQKN